MKILEKQIEFGTQLGETVIQLARMELQNYSKKTLPLAEYFDQKGLLSVVDGERQPNLVYDDFSSVTTDLLVKAATKSIASTPTANNKHPSFPNHNIINNRVGDNKPAVVVLPKPEINGVRKPAKLKQPIASEMKSISGINVVYTMGGPGSNKSLLASTYCQLENPQWICVPVGQQLRTLVDKGGGTSEFSKEQIREIKSSLNSGEFMDTDLLMKILGSIINKHVKRGNNNFIVDGFPRNVEQMRAFETKVG